MHSCKFIANVIHSLFVILYKCQSAKCSVVAGEEEDVLWKRRCFMEENVYGRECFMEENVHGRECLWKRMVVMKNNVFHFFLMLSSVTAA